MLSMVATMNKKCYISIYVIIYRRWKLKSKYLVRVTPPLPSGWEEVPPSPPLRSWIKISRAPCLMRSEFEIPCPAPPSSKLDDRATGPPGNTAPTLKRGGAGAGKRGGKYFDFSFGLRSGTSLCKQIVHANCVEGAFILAWASSPSLQQLEIFAL